MRRFLKSLARICTSLAILATLVPGLVHAQVQPVPKWHSDPLLWCTARNVNTFPYYVTPILHGMGVESDTLGPFSLADAVLSPNQLMVNSTSASYGGTAGIAAYALRDSMPLIAKLRFESDTITTTSGGATSTPLVTCDTLVVNLFYGTWLPALTGNTTQPVTPARWVGNKVYEARVVVATGGTDSATTVVECPIPASVLSANTGINASWTVRVGTPTPAWTVLKPITHPEMGGKFYAVVQSIAGTFPAIRASIGYYRLE